MKKGLIVGLLSIEIGFLAGNILFNKTKIIPSWKRLEKYYFIQEGIYSSYENMKKNLANITTKAIDLEDKKYYVYVGITKRKEIADKIINLYKNKGINVRLTEKYLSSDEFLQNVLQFDYLLEDKKDEEEILTIQNVVLANYEEIIKKE